MKFKFLPALFLSLTFLNTHAQILNENDLAAAPVVNSIEDAMKDPLRVNRLDLTGNKLTTIPAEVYKLTNLQELVLNNNKLKTLPQEISGLKHLEILYLNGNIGFNLEQAFPVIAKISSLRELWLRESQYTSIPENIDQLGVLKNLRLLHLGSNKLMSVPNNIGKLKTLYRLDIEMNNGFTKIPATIGDLKELKELDLEDNNLVEIPAELGKLKNLYDLDIQGNDISTLPEGLSKMKSLQHLNISGNPIKSLPTDFNQFPAMEILDMSAGLTITFNPETFEEVENRVVLQIDWAKTFIDLSQLKSLKELIIDHSNFTELPETVSKLKQIQRLELEDNKIDDSHRDDLKRWLPGVRIVY